MNLTDVRAALEGELYNQWQALYPEVPILFENTATVDLAQQETPFIGCSIRYTGGDQASMGSSPWYRYHGLLYLDVYVKALTGTQQALGLMDDLIQIFRSRAINGVQLRTPVPASGAVEQGWMRRSLNVPFWFDTQ